MPSLAKKDILFTIDLRIQQIIFKLPVYQSDNQEALILRLTNMPNFKSNYKSKLSEKLLDQFKKIVNNGKVSQRVNMKIQSLINKSKELNASHEKNDNNLNETPFKILQQSISYGKKPSVQKYKKSYTYLEKQDPILNNQYGNHNQIPIFNRFQMENRTYMPGGASERLDPVAKKYQALDRKCQNYIIKNIQKNYEGNDWTRCMENNMKLGSKKIQEHRLYETQNYENLHKYMLKRQYVQKGKQPLRQLNQNFSQLQLNQAGRKYSNVDITGRYSPIRQIHDSETFKDYKIRKYANVYSCNINDGTPVINRKRHLSITNWEELRSSKSFTKINYSQLEQREKNTKYDYNSNLNRKLSCGAIKRCNNKKYNYLAE